VFIFEISTGFFIDRNDFLKVLVEILADFVDLEVIFEGFWGFATLFSTYSAYSSYYTTLIKKILLTKILLGTTWFKLFFSSKNNSSHEKTPDSGC
jgi:hypothetical protein